MTVKSKRGRRRYVAFVTDPGLTRESVMHTLGGKQFNIIQCAEGMMIVRCAPDRVDECIASVRQIDSTSEALTVSGTLMTLRDRYPLLKETAPPKPHRTPTSKK